MKQADVLKWHDTAVLVGPDGTRTGAGSVDTAPSACTGAPSDPKAALPGFFAALRAGKTPLIGTWKGPMPKGEAGRFLTMTGGSTGTPKRVLRSSQSWRHSMNVMADRMDIGPTARVSALGDLSHSLALYAGVEALVLGAEFHALAGLKRSAQAAALAQRQITHLYVTPTQIRLLVPGDFSSVRQVIVGGGFLDKTTRETAEQLFPNAEITVFYGASETSFITLANSETPDGSVGKAFDGVEIEIRDEAGVRQSVAQTGFVWVQSPMVFDGYVGTESKTTRKVGGWITVGEMGWLDEAGNLFLSGRADRLVNVADTIVSLEQVEGHLLSHPDVTGAACFAEADPLRGTRIVAVLSATRPVKLSEIAAGLPRSSQPAKVLFLDDWPRLASGKDDLAEIRRRAGLE